MKNKGLIATIVIMSAVIVTLIVALIVMQMSSIVTINDFIKETQTYETSDTAVTETVEIETETADSIVEDDTVKSNIKKYTSSNGYINIEYPELSGITDNDLQKKINEKLYNNAISIIKLYPISTALQRLNISCNVKKLNDESITVLYEGKVVGINASGNNVNLKGESSYKVETPKTLVPNVSINDPYLDGFVDPFYGNSSSDYTIPNISNNDTVVINNDYNSKTELNNDNKSHGAADIGPSVSSPIKPTSSKDNKGLSSSDTIVNGEYSSNGTYKFPNPDGSNLPVSDRKTFKSNGAPIYGYTGTSVSASTISQKIFYTNNIDLRTGENITLNDYISDFDSLAKYARSKDVEFINIDENKRNEVRNYIRKTIQSTLAEHLENNSDFKNTDLKEWPKHFSYKDDDGTIYFTIKLSSRLGNYAIIKYKK